MAGCRGVEGGVSRGESASVLFPPALSGQSPREPDRGLVAWTRAGGTPRAARPQKNSNSQREGRPRP